MEVGWRSVIAGDENEGNLPLGKMEGRTLQGAHGGGGGQCARRQLEVLTSLVCARWQVAVDIHGGAARA